MLILLFALISLTFLSLNKTLSFGLTGDDWMTLYRYILDFPTLTSHFKLASYINNHSNYNFADLIMGIIYRQFSFNPYPYYLVSMVLRIITAISFYLAVSTATKDKLTGYLSALLFSVMFAGIETTNWVFNMNTYVSITLFNIFIYFYTRKDNFGFVLKCLILGIVLGLSFIITPNRMHGLLFAIPFIALFKLKQFNKQSIIFFFLRTLLLYLPILGFRFLVNTTNDVTYGTTIIASLSQIEILRSILASIGNVALPEKIYEYFGLSQNGKAVVMFFILLFTAAFFLKSRKNFPEISKFALLSLSLILSFVIMPLLIFDPKLTMQSDHRYLIIPGAFMMVVFACFFKVLWKSKIFFLKTVAVLFIGIIFLLNIFSLQNYFYYLSSQGRLARDSQKYFNYLRSQITRPDNSAPMAFLFITDDQFKLYNSITFGFPYHMMLIDKRFSLDFQKSSFPVDNLDSLINVLNGPSSKELKRYGYDPVQIPLENVYFFKFENDTLTNVTKEGRKLLIERLPNLK